MAGPPTSICSSTSTYVAFGLPGLGERVQVHAQQVDELQPVPLQRLQVLRVVGAGPERPA